VEFEKSIENIDDEIASWRLLILDDVINNSYQYKELGRKTFAQYVLENYSEFFDCDEIKTLIDNANSYYDFYEVQEVLGDKGYIIKSLFTDFEGLLENISESYQLKKRDIFLVRGNPEDDVLYSSGLLAIYPPSYKKLIKERIEKSFNEYTKRYGNIDYPEFSKEHWIFFLQTENIINNDINIDNIYTRFGKYQPCEIRWKVNLFNPIMETIKLREDFEFVKSKEKKSKKKKKVKRYQFNWITRGIEEQIKTVETASANTSHLLETIQVDPDEEGDRIFLLGSLYIDPDLCRLETTSVELAEFAISYFDNLFGNALKFKRLLKKKIDMDSDNQEEEIDEPASIIPPDEKRNVLINMMYDHYKRTLDEKIPLLNNLTPREARKDPAVLPTLIDWLKDLENAIEHNTDISGDRTIINMLKEELNIDY
jgi:hypothetical protein